MNRSEYPPGPKENLESGKSAITAPPIESLLAKDNKDSYWPDSVKNSKELELQAEMRRDLLSSLEQVFRSMPVAGVDIKEAVESNKLDAGKAAEMYDRLSSFILDEESNSRIMLYLPFEILPPKNWQSESPVLDQAIKNFTAVYMKKWHELLSTHDVRTNFADGDTLVSEDVSLSFPRVSKAAHFIPMLIEKELLSAREALQMLEQSDDSILRESIADTLSHLDKKGLLPAEDLAEMQNSNDTLVRNMASIIIDERKNPPLGEEKDSDESEGKNWLAKLGIEIEEEAEEASSARESSAGEISEARMKWEERKDKQNIVAKYSKEIAQRLSDRSLSAKDVTNLLAEGNNLLMNLSVARAIGARIESLAKSDLGVAKSEYGEFETAIKQLWESGNPQILDELDGVLIRFANVGVLDKSYLANLGISVRGFENEFSLGENQAKEELEKFKDAANKIESNEDLSKVLYPVSIVYGSKIKGYAERSADTDIAVFIKPSQRIEDRAKIQEQIEKTFGVKALEFWLEEKEGTLSIRNFTDRDAHLGDSDMPYVLFTGVWAGKDGTVKELHEKLLAGYLKSKEDRRGVWLEEMERDTLQYRLMHRGYDRFYPRATETSAEQAEEMDMGSAFWDAGYRRLATKLFVKKVFLPKLEQ